MIDKIQNMLRMIALYGTRTLTVLCVLYVLWHYGKIQAGVAIILFVMLDFGKRFRKVKNK